MPPSQPGAPSTPSKQRPAPDDSTPSRRSLKRTIDEIYEPTAKLDPDSRIATASTTARPANTRVMATIPGQPAEPSRQDDERPLDVDDTEIGSENPTLEDPEQDLDPFDWEDLELRFSKAMDKCKEDESALAEEAELLFRLFSMWMSVTPEHEDNRALKRLRTRIAYVQGSEEKLAQKKEHYHQVVEAFKNALALLGQPA